MCYGNLDPKHAMRDIEAQLKGVSFQPLARTNETSESTASAPASGLLAWVRAAMARLKRKDQAHV